MRMVNKLNIVAVILDLVVGGNTVIRANALFPSVCFAADPTPITSFRRESLREVITIDCPTEVQAEIANAPAGWSVEKGPGAKYGFLSVQIQVNAGKTSIGCVYGNKGQFGAFVLSRKIPDGLVCKVENESVHPRFVTCRPKGSRTKN
jgi:hypothetical protein